MRNKSGGGHAGGAGPTKAAGHIDSIMGRQYPKGIMSVHGRGTPGSSTSTHGRKIRSKSR
jgi:hypothetical protein